MNAINTTQVQLTNDASTVSKHSAVSKNYFKDDFIGEFVDKKKSRASLIHLGYYTRAVIINKLITDFIQFVNFQKISKFQIISCGCGFDTTYWRLSEADLLKNSLFVEIDFSNVIQRKIFLIDKSEKLKYYLSKTEKQTVGQINKLNFNYYLLEADLCSLDLIEELLNEISIDFDIPTLFLSECVITYMKEYDSSKLVEWMCRRFKNCGFINYEQIHPEDGFGQVMLRHFNKLQSPLLSVLKYPDLKSHYCRYKNHGFKNSFSVSEWDALMWLTTEDERRRVFSLELFDEFEEFHLKCVHYVVAIAGNGILSDWTESFPSIKKPNCSEISRKQIKADVLNFNLELFRHSICSINGQNFLFGGCYKQRRSPDIHKINCSNNLDVQEIKNSGNAGLQLDMVYGSVVYFKLQKTPFVCVYGGRTSPNKVWNNGSPVIFEYADGKFLQRLTIKKDNPVARYRSPMVCINASDSEAVCWVFGGRTGSLESLSSLCQLSIKCDNDKNLDYTWKEYENGSGNWPCNRMSHSFTSNPDTLELFMIGGLTLETSHPLNDMWKWCCGSESWEKVELIGHLLPRYGHTAHLKDEMIYLVGGVNTLSGEQPGLGIINLKKLTVTEYKIMPSVSEPVLLFNHTTLLVDDGDDAEIRVIGGGGNCFSFGTYLNQQRYSALKTVEFNAGKDWPPRGNLRNLLALGKSTGRTKKGKHPKGIISNIKIYEMRIGNMRTGCTITMVLPQTGLTNISRRCGLEKFHLNEFDCDILLTTD